MPPCLYICCHFEISNEHDGPPSRPRATSRTMQDGRRTSRRHSPNRERPRERSRADRQRHHSHHRSQSPSVSISLHSIIVSLKSNCDIREPTTTTHPQPYASSPKHPQTTPSQPKTSTSPPTNQNNTNQQSQPTRSPSRHQDKQNKTTLPNGCKD